MQINANFWVNFGRRGEINKTPPTLDQAGGLKPPKNIIIIRYTCNWGPKSAIGETPVKEWGVGTVFSCRDFARKIQNLKQKFGLWPKC